MPLIQLKLGPEMMKRNLSEEVLQPVAVQVAKAMEWPLERLTVTGEVIQNQHWFNKDGRQPLAQIYWLEGKSQDECQKMMQTLAYAVATVLKMDTNEVNVMAIELKQGSLWTKGRFL